MRPSKTNDVLRHMQLRGSITAKEAWELYGVARIGSLIHRLRHRGIPIETVYVTFTDKYGRTGRYGKFYYRGEDGIEASTVDGRGKRAYQDILPGGGCEVEGLGEAVPGQGGDL